MKKYVSPILILVITLASMSSVLPQKSVTGLKARSTDPRLPVDKTTEFQNARAFTDGSTVWIEWQMASEKNNYGFYVYRIDGSGKSIVGEDVVQGSYFRAGNQRTYGETYSALDRNGSLEAAYIVEAVGLDGTRKQTAPIVPVFSDDLRGLPGFASEDKADKADNSIITENILTYTKALQEEMKNNALVPDLNTHKWVIAQPGVKIGVRSPGMHRVTAAELSAGGFNTASDPSLWQLYVEGNQQAIVVGAGGSYVEFFGEGTDTIETDIQAYYLINGNSPGKRVQTRVARPSSGTVVMQRYDQTVSFKERTVYNMNLLNGDAGNFFGRSVLASPSTTFSFPLSGIDTTANSARITVYFQGTSPSSHEVQLVLNGNAIGSAFGAGVSPFSASFDIPVSHLVEGNNGLQMASIAPGPPADISSFDRIELSFPRKFQATSNKLFFYTQNDRKANVDGFSSSNVRVFDTTLEGEMTELLNLQFAPQGSGFGTVMPAARGRRFVAFDQSTFLSAASITQNNQEMLSVPANAADLVIISHKNFLVESEAWAQYRRNQGFAVKVVDVNEIYDEFNYGVVSADPLKDFLEMTSTTWADAPGYVLLMGDTTIDPRNYFGDGFFNFVPTRMNDTLFEETASDEYLADFNGDGLAEMAVGRIAARNGATITTVFNKTQNWEQSLGPASLNRGGVFACDVPDGYNFCNLNLELMDELPTTMPNTLVRRGLAPPANEMTLDPNAQANLVAAMNTGKYIVNYAGHGSAGVWAASTFFGNSTVSQLNNVNNESIYTMLTCLNGYFILRTTNSIAENLLHSTNGGAVAAWASTGQTTPDIQRLMGLRFYSKVNEGQIPRLGDLIRDAKAVLPPGSDVRFSWALLGDPMLKVRQPAGPDFSPAPLRKSNFR